MKNHHPPYPQSILPSLRFASRGLSAAALGLACLVAYHAQAANQYFDVNGSSAGYGVVNGGSYSWDDPNWAATSGGTAATGNWVAGNFARFQGGASGNAYTVTVNNDESMAGLYETVSGVSLIINAAGSGTLDVVSGDQGFLVSGSASAVTINAPISGSGGVGPELSGHLYLYGNNTYAGGTALGYSGAPLVYFNNNNAFGTGPINIVSGVSAGSYFALLGTGGTTITLPNTFSFASSGSGFNFAADANTPVVSAGNWTLGANNVLIRNSGGSSSPLTLSGAISGGGNVTLSANNSSTIIMSGANTYSGTTTVTGAGGVGGGTPVTLKLGAANTLASSSQVIMAGGTLDPGGFHQAMESTTLSLTGNSVIDFQAGAAELDFANSSSATWTPGLTLNLDNYTQGTDLLRIGTDGTGLTSDQLQEIGFNGTDYGFAAINDQGFVYDLNNPTPVPEPSTALLGLLGGLGALIVVRRRTV